VIAANEVTKRYPEGREALRNVSFAITAGEMVFLTGHSGAGKSTLFKLLTAIERPTSGSIVINGQNLAALRSNAIPYLRRKLGLIFQDRKLLFDRSVLDNVLLPLAIVGHQLLPRIQAIRQEAPDLRHVVAIGGESDPAAGVVSYSYWTAMQSTECEAAATHRCNQ
jgi:cell division transport system ATP-binding protein